MSEQKRDLHDVQTFLNVGLDVLTDEQLISFETLIQTERRRRNDEYYRAKNVCPECFGSGCEGTESNHEPCWRCKNSGKYVPNNC